ncbi:MAG: acetyl-CoA carboxylase biotin carboxyl carrier protein subunit [Algibacter sp.]|uniref:acetyl-CoA carboxylase biotin carboxyl carrier protein subunit n=1 Tax=Algibacter sp. TaxID=1872428 RepID=UPI0032984E70
MDKCFKVKVNNSFDFNITEGELSSLDLFKTSENNFHILQNNKSINAKITEADFQTKTYQVTLRNHTYNVSISNALDMLIKDMGLSAKKAKQIDVIKAPMPGLILELHVEVGQEVKENDTLFILEAMKMENSISSPRAGIIKSISIKNGDPVEKNQLLIEFDS